MSDAPGSPTPANTKPEPSRKRNSIIVLSAIAALTAVGILLGVFVVAPQQRAAEAAKAAQEVQDQAEADAAFVEVLADANAACASSAELRRAATSKAEAVLASHSADEIRPGEIDTIETTLRTDNVAAFPPCEPGEYDEFDNATGAYYQSAARDLLIADWLGRLAASEQLACPSIFERFETASGCQDTDPALAISPVEEIDNLDLAISSECVSYWEEQPEGSLESVDIHLKVVAAVSYEMTFLSGNPAFSDVGSYCNALKSIYEGL